MKKYEYKVESVPFPKAIVFEGNELKKIGLAGWELVSVTSNVIGHPNDPLYRYYLKREKQ